MNATQDFGNDNSSFKNHDLFGNKTLLLVPGQETQDTQAQCDLEELHLQLKVCSKCAKKSQKKGTGLVYRTGYKALGHDKTIGQVTSIQ